ncbi:MAG: molybdopterin-guanine dinucleotide biosynthesis protein B [Deltaproteobacteria bacterium]|nr:molybdopterin-guanine dinucleotide biosynthesis protein B [Deltaproteobacteria bacterium]
MYENIISFVAKGTDSGKTYIIERIIEELKSRGRKVTAVKHSLHAQNLDIKGKDTHKFAQRGADRIMVFSEKGLFLYEQQPPSVEYLVRLASKDVDIILIEGYKAGPFKKIEVFNHKSYETPLCAKTTSPDFIAIISDQEMAVNLPHFRFDNIEEICDFLEQHTSIA